MGCVFLSSDFLKWLGAAPTRSSVLAGEWTAAVTHCDLLHCGP